MPKKIAPPHEFTRSYALSFTIETLDAGQLSHKQALMQARQLEANTPYNLEIQNFMANRLWALGLQDKAVPAQSAADGLGGAA